MSRGAEADYLARGYVARPRGCDARGRRRAVRACTLDCRWATYPSPITAADPERVSHLVLSRLYSRRDDDARAAADTVRTDDGEG